MRKIALFFEGQTEQIFCAALIKHIADTHSLFIKKEKLWGGKKFPAIAINVDNDEGDQENCDFYFLLVDCAADSRVVTAINERYDGLCQQGFDTIIGVRDLRPDFERDELSRFLAGATKALRGDAVVPLMVVAVMEAEAWFIAEKGHFCRLDPSLTRDAIYAALTIDIDLNTEDIELPCEALSSIYSLAGIEYDKSRSAVGRTVKAMDLATLATDEYLTRAPSLAPLVSTLGTILAPPPDA